MQRQLAKNGYRTTNDYELREETVFLWHSDFDEGMSAMGWGISFGDGWMVFVRPLYSSSGELLGNADSLDRCLTAIIEWAAADPRVWDHRPPRR